MDRIHVSIIIPVYNVEMYLAECLDSVLQQNFSGYEIICVNDASTDNSGEILQEYALKYEQIRIFTHTQNRGLSAARNTGLANAKGTYVWFVDSDDAITPDSLQELYTISEENQTDMVIFNIAKIYSEEKLNNSCKIQREPIYQYAGVYSGKELFCLFAEDKKLNPEAWRRFLRRSFLEERGILFYEGILHEDVLFAFLCFMNAGRAVAIGREYYIYRQRSGSIMHCKNTKRAESQFVILLQIAAYWLMHVFSEREQRAIEFCIQGLFDFYQYYRCFGKLDMELGAGGSAEKFLYKMLYKKRESKWLTLNESQLAEIASAEAVIVFGAGFAAFDIVNLLREQRIEIATIGVSNRGENPETFCGIHVDSMDNIAGYIKNAVVIIGVTEKYSAGIREKLEQLGYSQIIIPVSVAETEVPSKTEMFLNKGGAVDEQRK